MLDQISEAVIYTDPDFIILDWSATAERLYGYTAEEAIGSLFTDLIETRYQNTDYESVLEQFRSERHWHGEAIQIGKGGRELSVLASVTQLHDERGVPTRVVAVNRDITESSLREAALRESELRFRQFAENSQDVFWMSDLRRPAIFFVSDAYERVWGRSRESLYRDPGSFMAAVHPDHRAQVEQALQRQLAGAATSEEYRIVRPDGSERWVHDQAFPIRGDDGELNRVAGIARDITELRLAAKRRTELEARVQHTQRLESLGVLAGGIAHDYNNLLTGIIGNLDLALAMADDPQQVRDHVRQALLGSHAAAELTKQLVLYSGKSSATDGDTGWNLVVAEMSALLDRQLPAGARLEKQLASSLPRVPLTDQQARVVISNLFANAVEALGDERGTIVLKTGATEIDDATFQLRRPDLPHSGARFVTLTIKDDGCGIASDDLDRVFDPFYSTKFQGRGLGLASVYGIVREAGGWISVASAPGQGTTFTLYLPASPTSDAEPASEPAPIPRVLVADDELMVRQVLQRLLKEAGYQAELARDGAELLQLYEAAPRSFSCVILDVNMPVMDGIETLAQLRQRDATLPVLFCTGGTDPRVQTALDHDPYTGRLDKPFSLANLREQVATLIAGS